MRVTTDSPNSKKPKTNEGKKWAVWRWSDRVAWDPGHIQCILIYQHIIIQSYYYVLSCIYHLPLSVNRFSLWDFSHWKWIVSIWLSDIAREDQINWSTTIWCDSYLDFVDILNFSCHLIHHLFVYVGSRLRLCYGWTNTWLVRSKVNTLCVDARLIRFGVVDWLRLFHSQAMMPLDS